MNPFNGAPSSATLQAVKPFRLLIVEKDDLQAQGLERALREEVPSAHIQRASTVSEARQLLDEASFDAALVNHELPDGDSCDVLRFLDQAALRMPVLVLTRDSGQEVLLKAWRAGASDCIHTNGDDSHFAEIPTRLQAVFGRHREETSRSSIVAENQAWLFETVRSNLASVKHEINNPLAIISGNAQLLLELATVIDLDEELVKSIRDIQEASLRIAGSLNRLGSLKDLLAGGMQGDGSLRDVAAK